MKLLTCLQFNSKKIEVFEADSVLDLLKNRISKLSVRIYFPKILFSNKFFLKIMSQLFKYLFKIDKESILCISQQKYWHMHNFLPYKIIGFESINRNTLNWLGQEMYSKRMRIFYYIDRKRSIYKSVVTKGSQNYLKYSSYISNL